ncbi:MAG: NFACT family protein [Candidatus Micrarchaeia archaeon]
MQRTLSLWEYSILLQEGQSLLKNRLSKAYEISPKLIRLDFGKLSLIISLGKYFYMSENPPEAPQIPSSFAMFIRKHLGGKFLDSFEQYGNDRIYVLGFSNGQKIVIEQYAHGNMFLLDEKDIIVRPYSFKPTALKTYNPGQKYEWPSNPSSPDKKFFIGKLYSEAISSYSNSQLEKLILHPVFLVYPDAVSLMPLPSKEGEKKFDSFSLAIEHFILNRPAPAPKKAPEQVKLDKRLEEQERALKKIDEQIPELEKICKWLEKNLENVDEQIILARKSGEKKLKIKA